MVLRLRYSWPRKYIGRARKGGSSTQGDEALAPAGPGRRVLIVDDNRDAADSLGAILQLMGNETVIAYDGHDAQGKLGAQRFDAALLDIGMPGMNGYDLAQRIRALPQGGGLVLIALTGWGQEEDKRRALDAGFDHHLTKPVDAAVVARLLLS